MEMLESRTRERRLSQEGMLRPGQVNEPVLASSQLTHTMDPSDLECPKNWAIHRKLYTSVVAWLFAATVAFGATAYTVDLDLIVADFGFDKKKNPNYLPIGPISGFSLYLFGIFFAPIWTPHVTERIGRSIFYLTSLPLCGAFLLGAGFVKSFAGLAVLRFLAGFSGGPCLVLIEGTFADIWSAKTTNTYYAFQGTAQFFGTALGPLIGGLLVQATNNWRWTQWFSAVLCGIVALLGLGLSESYQREIPRRRAKRRGRVLQQGPPLSGSTFSEIFRITVMDPMIQVFTDPPVMLSTVILTFNFAVVLQFFITVPVALGTKPPNGAGFTLVQIGEAFTSAIVGSTGAALVVILLDQITTGMLSRKGTPTFATIEYRLLPAMIGPILVTAALFWIGTTVGNPTYPPVVPIIGTAVFVWGVAMVIFSVIPYLFDAFPAQGTLSALTAAATTRLLFAGILPLVILHFFTAVTPKWALYIFGFISIPMWAIPFVLFRFGPTLREKSKYGGSPVTSAKHHKLPQDEETAYAGMMADSGHDEETVARTPSAAHSRHSQPSNGDAVPLMDERAAEYGNGRIGSQHLAPPYSDTRLV